MLLFTASKRLTLLASLVSDKNPWGHSTAILTFVADRRYSRLKLAENYRALGDTMVKKQANGSNLNEQFDRWLKAKNRMKLVAVVPLAPNDVLDNLTHHLPAVLYKDRVTLGLWQIWKLFSWANKNSMCRKTRQVPIALGSFLLFVDTGTKIRHLI